MDRAGQTKTTHSVFPGLEAQKANFDISAGFFLLHPAEEMGEGLIQVTQGFLWRTFGNCIHPGQFGLLQRVQFTVQIDGSGCLFPIRKGLLLASELTVECKARRTCMTDTGGFLFVVQVKFGLEGAQYQHRTIVLSIQDLHVQI